jgi:protein-disulfide isomerase
MRHRERITPQPRQVVLVDFPFSDEDWERLQECLRRALDL